MNHFFVFSVVGLLITLLVGTTASILLLKTRMYQYNKQPHSDNDPDSSIEDIADGFILCNSFFEK